MDSALSATSTNQKKSIVYYLFFKMPCSKSEDKDCDIIEFTWTGDFFELGCQQRTHGGCQLDDKNRINWTNSHRNGIVSKEVQGKLGSGNASKIYQSPYKWLQSTLP